MKKGKRNLSHSFLQGATVMMLLRQNTGNRAQETLSAWGLLKLVPRAQKVGILTIAIYTFMILLNPFWYGKFFILFNP